MRRSFLAAAVLAAAALPIAACGDSTSGTGTGTGVGTTSAPSAAPVGDEQVQWIDKVCGEILALTEAQTTAPPDLENADDAEKALKAVDTYITSNIDVVDDTIAGLKDIGDSPIAGGDDALNALVAGLEALRTGYQSTKDKIADVDAADPAAAQSAMLEAFAGLSAGGEEFGKALESVENNMAIEEAGNQAPNCQKLDDGVVPTTT